MTYLFARCGGDCFILADSVTGAAGVLTFDACGFDPDMPTERLSRKASGFRLNQPREYSVIKAYGELGATRHYAEMNDTALYPNQIEAWALDPRQEW